MKTVLKVILIVLFLNFAQINQAVAERNSLELQEGNFRDYRTENLVIDKTSYSELLKAAIETILYENFDLAEKYLSLAVRLKPKEDKAWQILSVVYMEKKMYKNAYVCAKNAYELNPKDPTNKFNYGQFLKKQEGEGFYYDPNTKTIVMNSIKSRDILEEAMNEENIQNIVEKIDNNNSFEVTKTSKTALLARIKKN